MPFSFPLSMAERAGERRRPREDPPEHRRTCGLHRLFDKSVFVKTARPNFVSVGAPEGVKRAS